MLTYKEIDEFVQAIAAKYPALRNCWGAMGDLRLHLERAGKDNVQNHY
jgi:hypothetical protein